MAGLDPAIHVLAASKGRRGCAAKRAFTPVFDGLWLGMTTSQPTRTAVTSTSTLNSGRVKPETITSVEAKLLPGT